MKRKEEIVSRLRLQKHPEGGFFAETHRDVKRVEAEDRPGVWRPASTAIYYLLGKRDFSALHRIASDEAWHFYEGSPLRVTRIAPDGSLSHVVLGTDLDAGQVHQAVVPAGHWFGAKLEGEDSLDEHAYALVGCTVSPGFDFEDFELADATALTRQFPEHENLIKSLTRESVSC